MCEQRSYVKGKLDRLIESMDRLSASLHKGADPRSLNMPWVQDGKSEICRPKDETD